MQNSVDRLENRSRESTHTLKDLQKIVTDLSQQVNQQKSEILKLRQDVANQPTQPSSFSAPAIENYRPQPRFPVTVEEYISRTGGVGQPVKYDYKEKLLVHDPDREGNLLVVQDEGRYYVVPSFYALSTKSDYSTYLEKYYHCAKPMAGTIWISDPVHVIKTESGWQFNTTGELEIR